MIEWKKYFDRIFVVAYAPNHRYRKRLDDELDRVGIGGSGILEYRITVPCVYDKLIMESMKNEPGVRRVGHVNESLAVLDILKYSEIMGYERVLLLEEDAAFLNDMDEIAACLEDLPKGFDTIQLDHAFVNDEQKVQWKSLLSSKSCNDHFVDSDSKWFGMGTGTVYYKHGIEKTIKCLEKRLVAIDTVQKYSGERRAISKNPMVVQVCYSDSVGGRLIGERFYDTYRMASIDLSKYNYPSGVVRLF